jgi:hypothetical protein
MKVLGEMFLAGAFEEQVRRATQDREVHTREWLLGASLALAIGLTLALWFYFRSRKASDKHDRERLSQMTQSRTHEDHAGDTEDSGRRRRRKRRRKRDHRPRNPPLSQTGGLPPPRPDDQLPKY